MAKANAALLLAWGVLPLACAETHPTSPSASSPDPEPSAIDTSAAPSASAAPSTSAAPSASELDPQPGVVDAGGAPSASELNPQPGAVDANVPPVTEPTPDPDDASAEPSGIDAGYEPSSSDAEPAVPAADAAARQLSLGATWQWQLSEELGEPLNVQVYDIDWESDPDDVRRLHELGIYVICYVSVGSWEDFRPDADDFPAAVIGADYEGWPGERYVDIRSPDLRALMERRFDVCRDSGFDAIEPDNMDVFELGEESGFALTFDDGVDYAHWLAEQAHKRGLAIGQKNASSLTAAIVADYDWALTESCFSDGDWCGDMTAYAEAGKPVFMCEYEAATFAEACNEWAARGYSPILKSLDLDAPVTFCP